ncbi:MAG TPA: copper ion binding protein [Thermomicrobiales bacterium]|nr:copper ion binding protein [Thermomicrobiales bacterium]
MASPTTEHITLTAPDISCGHCVSTVQQAVGEIAGVEAVMASADTKVIDVRFDPQVVSVDKIEAVLDDAGYPVQK